MDGDKLARLLMTVAVQVWVGLMVHALTHQEDRC